MKRILKLRHVMKQIALACCLLVAALAVLWAVEAFGESTATGIKTSEKKAESAIAKPVLDATTSATHRYLPVVFASHDKHAKVLKIACDRCHHDMKMALSDITACSDCHDKKDAPVDLTKAMHQSCRGCHLESTKINAASKAPVNCLGCHTERK